MITVRVLNRRTGKPVKGARVALAFSGGLLPGGVTSAEYTDEYGEANFDYDARSGEVFVNGRTVKRGSLRGLVIVYI